MNIQKPVNTLEEARSSLREELREVFDLLVEDYRFSAHVRHGKRFVSYVVLADLVKAGWRRSAEAIDE